MATFITNKNEIREEASKASVTRVAMPWKAPAPARREKTSSRVPDQELADFFEHLATLLGSGVTLVSALDFIAGSTRRPGLKAALTRVNEALRAGDVFSEALTRETAVFDRAAAGMIKAGEAGGTLESVCSELAASYSRRAEARSQFFQALTYPAVVACFGVLTVLVLLLFVIPKVGTVFEAWDTPLPLMTRLLLAASRFMRHGGFLAVLIPFAALPLLARFKKLSLMPFLISIAQKTPFLKDLFSLGDFVRLMRTWGMLLRSGVPILEAIRSSRDVVASDSLRASLAAVSEKILRGERLQEALQHEDWLPDLAKHFLRVGEETGTLDGAFDKIARFYERQLAAKLKIVSTLVEPALILLVGVSVGVLVISMLLPIFEMSLAVK